jgi:hypothetical protein
VARHQTLTETALAHALANAKPAESLRDVEVVRTFIDFLLARLEPDLQPPVRPALETDQLGYRPEAGRIGVILPSARVDLITEGAGKTTEDHVSE